MMDLRKLFRGMAIFSVLALSSAQALASATHSPTHSAAGVRDPLKDGQSIMVSTM